MLAGRGSPARTPSVFLGGFFPDTPGVSMVMPVIVTLVSLLTQMCSSGGSIISTEPDAKSRRVLL